MNAHSDVECAFMQKYLEQTEKYIRAQELQKIYLSDDQQHLFFLKSMSGAIHLFYLDLTLQSGSSDRIDLSKAKQILPNDFAKCNFEFVEYFPKERLFYFLLDEKHNEFSNLYRLDFTNLSAGTTQLTSVKDARSFSWTKNHQTLFYSNRFPIENGQFKNEFFRINLDSGRNEFLFDDEKWIYKVGWMGIKLSDCESFVLVGVDKDNKRELTNFVRFSLEQLQKFSEGDQHPEEPVRILAEQYEDAGNYCLKPVEQKGFYFVSDYNKFQNLYYYDFTKNEVEAITDKKWINISTGSLKTNQGRFFVVTEPLKKSNKTKFFSIDLTTRKWIEKTLDGVYGVSYSQPYMLQMAFDQLPTVLFYDQNINFGKIFSKYVGSDLIHCTYEIKEYTSFDQLKIFSYLAMPKVPLKAVVIIAFYGGENYYHFHKQLFLENGIAIFSPAVRGSWGWGREWEDHLKNDLGGKEILDVIWAAKFIAKHLDLPENKVGLWGASHGGYSTLRALTMPSDFGGVDSSFNFGFGICECGFADLENFFLKSRIADWLVDLLGEYPKNETLYRDRSPAHFFENLKAPLFIRHGTSDSRVPLSTVQSFIELLQKSPVHHDIMIQEDQGHHTNDPEKQKVERARILKFVENVLA